MNIQEELIISGYQQLVFASGSELDPLYLEMVDSLNLNSESSLRFPASVFYNLGRVHGIRAERARRKKGDKHDSKQ